MEELAAVPLDDPLVLHELHLGGAVRHDKFRDRGHIGFACHRQVVRQGDVVPGTIAEGALEGEDPLRADGGGVPSQLNPGQQAQIKPQQVQGHGDAEEDLDFFLAASGTIFWMVKFFWG